MKNLYYQFREAKGIKELESLLKLRSRIANNSYIKAYCKYTESLIELDDYDVNAYHFGLFEYDGKDMIRPVGYMRVIHKGSGKHAEQVQKIAKKYDLTICSTYETKKMYPFPVLKNFQMEQASLRGLTKPNNASEKWCEVSRFLISEDVRSVRLAMFIINSAVACFHYGLGFTHCIFSCEKNHDPIYKSFGANLLMRQAGQTNSKSISVFSFAASDIENSRLHQIQKMAKAYLSNNTVCFFPSKPKCFSIPQIATRCLQRDRIIAA